jgi:hypothetical protein
MRRTTIAFLLLVGLAITGCGSMTAAKTSDGVTAKLRVTYSPHNNKPTTYHWTVTCNPVGGSLKQAKEACTELNAHSHLLTGPIGICPDFIVLGGSTSTVTGVINGVKVNRTVTLACPGGALAALRVLLTSKSYNQKQ